jgi:hypothetical protein
VKVETRSNNKLDYYSEESDLSIKSSKNLLELGKKNQQAVEYNYSDNQVQFMSFDGLIFNSDTSKHKN